MKRKILAPLAVLCTVLALAASPVAAQVSGPLAWSQDSEDLEGWTDHGNGLWTRTLEDGTVETEALGRTGLIQVLDQLDFEMVRLVEAYLLDPTDEMKEVLDTHLALIQRMEEGLKVPEQRSEPPSAVTCSTSYAANAGPLSSCGNFANASSSYSGDSASACFGLCDLYSYAYVRRTVCNDTNYTASQSCSKPGVINQSCSSSVSLTHNPVKSCYANAYASVYCPSISWFRSASKTSSSCGSGCSGCGPPQCTVKADCSGAGGGSRSCTGTCSGSWAIDDCYAHCDGTYYWCPSPPFPCPI